ncbi:MarR family winged helix-turn-helix transcriptional regulator [Roseibium sp.]|uniref:MarR family winged helix-turn-helix transcriptional regulator n=1 Tax=Roseibium sp. TaxID=1936156 RepID=UPI003D0ED69F
MDAWARLHRAGGSVLSRVEAKLKTAGYPPLSWYDVLLELRREPGHALRPGQIEKRILLAQYNVSRLIDRIVAEGYARKRKAAEDGRGVFVQLTGKGAALLDEMWPVYQRAVHEVFADHLTDQDAKDLWRILAKVVPEEG